jgi:hypothetical protein
MAQVEIAASRGLPPVFAPPYDSPIEHDFAHAAQHHWRPDVRVDTQVDVATRLGRFRLDFVVTAADGWRIGVECDGAAFHDAFRDAYRDAAILGAGGVDSIVRFRGVDLVARPCDIVYAFGMAFPATFTARGYALARRRASRPALEQVPRGWGRLTIEYPDVRMGVAEDGEWVDEQADEETRLDRGGEVRLLHRGRGRSALMGWQRRYAQILAHPARTLDEWARLSLAARQKAWAVRQRADD